MMRRMLKYPIPNLLDGDPVTLTLPWLTEIRAVGIQHGVITLWCDTPKDAQVDRARVFQVIGTGWDIPSPGTHLGTVFDGPFVWHVYETHPS
jgi:hypothetical protein